MKSIRIFAASAAATLATAVAQAQSYTDLNSAITQATNSLGQVGGKIVNFASLIIGLVGAGMLVWAFIKKAKGDPQSHDALFNWGLTLLAAIAVLQVLKAIYGW